jgi:hypothetical protein
MNRKENEILDTAQAILGLTHTHTNTHTHTHTHTNTHTHTGKQRLDFVT